MNHDLFAQLIPQYEQLKYALLHAQTFDPDHFGFPPLYYQVMETDQTRVGAFQKAISQLDLEDKTICEAGVGRLALSQYYLPKVRKAYLIENNPNLFPFIRQWIRDQGLEDKVELIFTDARTVQLPEQVDLVLGEMMSIFCADELQVAVFRHLRTFLRPEGQLLPGKVINIAQLAHTQFKYGTPHYPLNFTRHLPEVLSAQAVVNIIDFRSVEEDQVSFKIPITPLMSGKVNAVLLRSFVEILPGVNFTGTDSLMPPTVLQLAQPVVVKAGVIYHLEGQFTYGKSLDHAVFRLMK